MKTHINTNLKRSKLALLFATIFAVAIVSVAGFCFTNANADDTADPANAEINIPVSILNPEITTTGKWNATSWSPDPMPKFVLSGDFSGHTYTIEEKHQWVDNEECKATFDKDGLIITLATDDKGDVLYKTWKISNKLDGSSWYLVVDGKAEKMAQGKPIPLKAGPKYSFFYGEPQIFDVVSNTIDAPNYAVDGNDFDGNSVATQGQFPATFTLNSQAVEGKAYFEAGNPYALTLVFSDKYKDKDSVYHIAVNGKLIEGDDYYWTFNKELISTNPQEPTIFNPSEMSENPFTFEKKAAPEPIKSFKVVGTVFDYEGNVIPNADVWFYNSDVDFYLKPPLLTTKAGEDGKFALDGCYSGAKYPEDLTLVVMAKHYVAQEIHIDYKKAQTGLVDMTGEIGLRPAIFDIYSDNPHHKSFILKVVDQYPGKEPEVVQYRKMEYIGIEGFKSNGDDDYIYWAVQDAGALSTQADIEKEGTKGTRTITVTPEPEDGFTFANYLINDIDTYTVGQTIDLTKYAEENANDGIHVQVNYDASAESEGTAQTGDAGAYAAIALITIAIAAGAVYMLRRKNESC